LKRIHIIGSGPRTGTTLLAEVMISCFEIDKYSDHEARIYADEPIEGKIFLTKHPSDYYAVNLPLALNPNLYVICIIRDPRDAIASKHGSRPDIYWAGLRYWKLFISYYDILKKHSNFIDIKYEDFVSQPDKVQDYINSKIDFLKKKNKFSNYHNISHPNSKSINALKGVRPIKPVGIGNWKNHLPRIAGQLQLHGDITNQLIEFEYENNNEWLKLLDNIEPNLSNSFWPEFFTKKDLRARKYGEKIEVIKILSRRIGLHPTKVKTLIKKIIKRR